MRNIYQDHTQALCPTCNGANPPHATRCAWCDTPFTGITRVGFLSSLKTNLPILGLIVLTGILVFNFASRTSQTNTPWIQINGEGPVEPEAYLQDTLDFIQDNSIMALDWTSWRAQVLAEAGKPSTRADTHSAIRHALTMLGDHHSQLISPDVYKTQYYTSEGLWIMPPYPERTVIYNYSESVRPLPNTRTTENAGVRGGDVIETVNGQPAASMGASEFYRNLFGGSHVRLTLKREGEDNTLSVALDHPYLNPREIPEGRRINGRIGYIRLPGVLMSQVTDQYAEIVHQIIRDIDQRPTCGWVVDLQNNTGGYFAFMGTAIGPVLGGGEEVVWIDNSNGKGSWYYYVEKTRAGLWFDREIIKYVGQPYQYQLKQSMPPVAVLTDRHSASAAEAVAISFRGRPNTRAFGEPTSGVPTGNTGKVLSDGANLVVTCCLDADRTGRVYGYNERIQPDEYVTPGSPADQGTDNDPILAAAVKWLQSQPACAK